MPPVQEGLPCVKGILTLCMLAAAATLVACKQNASSSEEISPTTNGAAVASGDVAICGATGTPMTQADCAMAQQWIDQAKQGSASFNVPRKMVEGETTTLMLALGTAAPIDQTNALPANSTTNETIAPASNATNGIANDNELKAQQEPQEHPKALMGQTPQDIHNQAANAIPSGRVIDYSPLVGRRMAADLSGDAFDIQQTSERVQPISDTGTTYWIWRVTPKATGTHTLVLKTAVSMLDTRNTEISLNPTEYTQTVTVGVGPATILDWINELIDWLKDLKNLASAIAAFVVVLGGLWYALRHFGRQPPSTGDNNGGG